MLIKYILPPKSKGKHERRERKVGERTAASPCAQPGPTARWAGSGGGGGWLRDGFSRK